MLADGLTKPMTSTGYVEFGNEGGLHCLLRRLPTWEELKEEDLYKDDQTSRMEVREKKRASLATTAGLALSPKLRSMALFALFTTVRAQEPTQ